MRCAFLIAILVCRSYYASRFLDVAVYARLGFCMSLFLPVGGLCVTVIVCGGLCASLLLAVGVFASCYFCALQFLSSLFLSTAVSVSRCFGTSGS